MPSGSREEIVQIREPEWQAQEKATLHERAATLPDQDTPRVQRYRFIARQLSSALDIAPPPSLARQIAAAVEGETGAHERLIGCFEFAALAALAVLCVAGVVFSDLSPIGTWYEAERLAGMLRHVADGRWLMALGGCLGMTLATSLLPRKLGS